MSSEPTGPKPPRRYIPLLDDSPHESAGRAFSKLLNEQFPLQPRPQVRYPQPYMGAGGPIVGAADALFSELFAGAGFGSAMKGVSALTGLGVESSVESEGNLDPSGAPHLLSKTLTPGVGAPIDPTDPSVDIGGAELNLNERNIRKMRLIGRSIHAMITGGAGVVPAAVNLAESEGKFRPVSEDEAAVSIIGSTLGALLSPKQTLLHPIKAAENLGRAALEVVNPFGGNEAVSRELGTLGAGALPFMLSGGLAAAGYGGAEAAAAAAIPKAAALGADVAIGAGAGYAEGKAEQALGQDADPTRLAMELGGVALGLGAVFRIFSPRNKARAASTLSDATQVVRESVSGIAPGVEIDGVTSRLEKGKIVFRNAKGHFKKLSEEQTRAFEAASVQKASDVLQSTPQMQAHEQAAESADASNPQTYPSDMQDPEIASEVNIHAALYLDQAKQHVANLHPEMLAAEIAEMKRQTFDATLPLGERKTAFARAKALEQEAGLSQGNIPGQLPLDFELAAAQTVRNVLPEKGLDYLKLVAAEASVNGRPEYGQRLLQLAQRGSLPDAYHDEVRVRAEKVSKSLSRGLRSGLKGIYNGLPVQIAEKPRYGMALAKSLDGSGKIVVVKSEGFSPFPKAGSTVKLKDGRIVKINSVQHGKLEFVGTDAEGNQAAHNIGEIGDVNSSDNEQTLQAAFAEINTDDVQEIPPVKAVTKDGETVTVTGVGAKAAEVVTKSGRSKFVKRDEIKPSTANKPQVAQREGFPGPKFSEPQGYSRAPFAEAKWRAEHPETTAKPPIDYQAALEQDQINREKAKHVALGSKETVKRTADFKESGTYDVTLTDGSKHQIFRDPEDKNWYASGTGKHFSENFLGFTQEDALKTLRSRMATPEAAPVPVGSRQIVDFAPGTIPDPGHKILFIPVPKDQVANFEAAIKSGDVSPLLTAKGLQAHVLPVSAEGADLATYAIEVPASSLPLKTYSKAAKTALEALGGKATLESTVSPVLIPQEAVAGARFYRVSDAVMNNAVLSPEALGLMDQTAQTAATRNSVALNSDVPSEVAKPVEASKQAQRRTKKAAKAGKVTEVAAAKVEEAKSNIEALEAQASIHDAGVPSVQSLTNEPLRVTEMFPAAESQSLTRLPTQRRSFGFTFNAPAPEIKGPSAISKLVEMAATEGQRAFEEAGLNVDTEKYYHDFLSKLPVTPPDSPPLNVALGVSSEAIAHISLHEEPQMTRLPDGSLQPETRQYFEVNHYDITGQHLAAATKRFTNAQDVGRYLEEADFEHTNLTLFDGGEFVHKENPKVVARIVPTAQGKALLNVSGNETAANAKPIEAAKLADTMAEADALSQIVMGEIVQGVDKTPYFHETSRSKEFLFAEDARKALGEKFTRSKPLNSRTPLEKFKALPKITPDMVQKVQRQDAPATIQIPFTEPGKKTVKTKTIEGRDPMTGKKFSKEVQIEYEGEPTHSVVDVVRPGVSYITTELNDVADQFADVIRDYLRQQNSIPPAVKEAAQTFAEYHTKLTGRAPWDKNIRASIDQLALEDIEPKGIGGAPWDLMEDAINKGDMVSTTSGRDVYSPGVVRESYNKIRVGSTVNDMLKAVDKIVKQIGVGNNFPKTRADLIERGSKIQGVTRKFTPVTADVPDEIIAAVKKLKRQAQMLEQLAQGKVPRDKVNVKTGAADIDLLPHNEETTRAIGSIRGRAVSEGFTGAEDRARIPSMYANNPGEIVTKYGNLLITEGKPEAPEARVAQHIQEEMNNQTNFTPAYLNARDKVSTSPAQFSSRTVSTAYYSPTQQIVEILGGDPSTLTGSEITIRFPGSGEERSVPKSDVIPGSDPTSGLKHPALTDIEVEGKWGEVLQREPPAGFGQVEKDLGVFGERSRSVLTEALGNKFADLLEGMEAKGKGKAKTLSGSKEDLQQLMQIYTRAQWLDRVETIPSAEATYSNVTYSQSKIGEQGVALPIERRGSVEGQKVLYSKTLMREGKPVQVGASDLISDALLDAITAKDPKLVAPFKQAAYQYMLDQLGTGPYAELQAQAFAGILTPTQEEILRGWGKEFGLKNVPLAKIAQQLQERAFLDPSAMKYAVQLRSESKLLAWLESAITPEPGVLGVGLGGLGKGGEAPLMNGRVTVTSPRVGGLVWNLGSALEIGWKYMRKHPFTRLIDDALYYARDNEMKKYAVPKILERDLHERGISYEDIKTLKYMTQEASANKWETWEDIKENATINRDDMTPEKWEQYEYGYHKIRDFFDRGLEDIIREFLYRRVRPIEFDPKNADHLELARQLRVPIESLAKGAHLMPVTPQFLTRNGVWDLHGAQPSGFTHDEIEAFIGLRKDYPNAASLPPQPPTGVSPKSYGEMIDVFDDWKHYGIHNYWPLIHEGNMALTDTEGKILAWGQSTPDLLEARRELIKQGRLEKNADVRIEQQGDYKVDDILTRTVPKGADFKQVANAIAEQMKQDADDIRAIIIHTDRPSETLRKPSQVHAKQRVKGLQPVFDDPRTDFTVYQARIARMGYRRELISALKLLQNDALDRALSDAHSTTRLANMPALRSYALDRIAKAAGEQGWAERKAEDWMMWWNFLTNAPKAKVAEYFGGAHIEGIWNSEAWREPGSVRKGASDILKMQSLIRIGASPASALANLSQVMVTTWPKLIGPNVNELRAAQIAFKSQFIDGVEIYKAWKTGHRPEGALGRLWDVIDAAGADLTPTKQQAGSGRSYSDLFGGPPIRGGESATRHTVNWLHYKAMLMFNGAEKLNRYGTAIASVRRDEHVLGKPIMEFSENELAQSAQRARNLIRETQFLYDDLSLPKILQAGGPVGRVLFQFKPYLANILSYEKDLMVDVFARKPYAVRQVAAHVGALGALGGVVGLLYNPAFQAVGSAVSMATGKDALTVMGHQIPLTADAAVAQNRQQRIEDSTPEENFSGSTHFRAADMLYYGVPGLVGLNMGQRVGVSGLDIGQAGRLENLAGPYGSMYVTLGKAYLKYAGTRGSGPGLAAGALGSLAYAALAPKGAVKFPFSTAVAGAVTAYVGTSRGLNPFKDFFQNSAEGHNAMNSMLPTLVRNAEKSFELIMHGDIKDAQGRPSAVPAENQTLDGTYAAFGLPTIRAEEHSAAVSILTGQTAEYTNSKQNYISQIARKWAAGDFEGAYQSMYNAQQSGIEITESDVQDELKQVTDESLSTFQQRQPQILR